MSNAVKIPVCIAVVASAMGAMAIWTSTALADAPFWVVWPGLTVATISAAAGACGLCAMVLAAKEADCHTQVTVFAVSLLLLGLSGLSLWAASETATKWGRANGLVSRETECDRVGGGIGPR